MKKPSKAARAIEKWRKGQNLSYPQAAKLLKVSAGAVHHWENDKRQILAERVSFISEITGIAKADLRPDLFAS